MPEQTPQEYWVDWYLRDELSAEDEAAYETAMLESPSLQDELETTLALRAALAREAGSDSGRTAAERPARAGKGRAGWQSFAMAATVVLAVLSTIMWWRVGNEASGLELQLQALAQPRGNVLRVMVPIMRSAGSQTPDVIVQMPAGKAALLLDIELGLKAREEDRLQFALVDPQGAEVLSWQAAPAADGRATAVIAGELIPASRLWLQIGTPDGETLERRLLEFRAPE